MLAALWGGGCAGFSRDFPKSFADVENSIERSFLEEQKVCEKYAGILVEPAPMEHGNVAYIHGLKPRIRFLNEEIIFSLENLYYDHGGILRPADILVEIDHAASRFGVSASLAGAILELSDVSNSESPLRFNSVEVKILLEKWKKSTIYNKSCLYNYEVKINIQG